MKNQDLPSFDSWDVDSRSEGQPIGGIPTDSIDLDSLFTKGLTTSGSYDMSDDIWETTVGKLLHSLPIPAMLVDPSHRVIVANQACGRINLEYEEIVNAPVSKLFASTKSAIRADSLIDDVFETRKPKVVEAAIRIGERTIWGRLSLRCLRIRENRAALVLVEDLTAAKRQLVIHERHRREMQKEIQQRKKAQAAMTKVKEEWEMTFHAVHDSIMILDKTLTVIRANTASREMFGVTGKNLTGMKCYEYMHNLEGPLPHCPVVEMLRDGQPHSHEIRDDRLGKVLDVTAFPLRDSEGRLIGGVHIARDVTDRKTMEEQQVKLIEELTQAKQALEHLATHDSLTSLLNRRAILERIRSELSRAYRDSFPIGIVMIDLDNFKEVNDRYGHLTGDAVLRSTASRIGALVRPYDAVGRYGGEEFVVVLPGCDKEKSACLAERLRASFDKHPIEVEQQSYRVTLSCGVTAINVNSSTDIDDCIRAADEALYKAKRGGRNRVELT